MSAPKDPLKKCGQPVCRILVFVAVSALVLVSLVILRRVTSPDATPGRTTACEFPKDVQFKGTRPVLIQFLCSTCDSCQTMTSVMEKVGKENDGQVEIRVVEDGCECSSALRTRYGIEKLPATVLVDPSGAELWHGQGLVSYTRLSEAIEQNIFQEMETCSPKKPACE